MMEALLSPIGQAALYLHEVLRASGRSWQNRESVFAKTLEVIEQSWVTTVFAGFFVGGIMSLQFTLQMQMFNALSYLGALVTSATVREVGPLLIAFLLSGKIGAYISAELGTMKVGEQIDAIRCLGANPMDEVIAPRFLGIIMASFFLLSFGLIFSFFGGLLVASVFAGLPWEQYLGQIPNVLNRLSLLSGLIKCFAFSFVIAWICTYRGYSVIGGARQVGEGVVAAATQSMLALVFMDWVTSFVIEALLYG